MSTPNVLNLQLSRFIFDPKSGQKKKLNKVVTFKTTLDMGVHLEKKAKKGDPAHAYHLKAVLVHKGTSAYSGHYISYVFNEK